MRGWNTIGRSEAEVSVNEVRLCFYGKNRRLNSELVTLRTKFIGLDKTVGISNSNENSP